MNKARYGKRTILAACSAAIAGGLLAAAYYFASEPEPRQTLEPAPSATAEPASPAAKSLQDWVAEYGELPLADAHNHGAVMGSGGNLKLWEEAGVDRVVLFGEVSKQVAAAHDKHSWEAYEDNPDRVVPFFAGIDLADPAHLETARSLLEQGYFGIGEIAGASSYSPVVSNAEWKAEHPMDGILPQLYELCAEYGAPILLHIDPPNGLPILKLEEALEAYPDTAFIFAHANAYNTPGNIEHLLAEHPNLYIDFFAGFTAFNPESSHRLEDFVGVIRKFPDRFMVSTDFGYGIPGGEPKAIEAMYMLLDLLKDDPELVRKVAYDNLDALIRNQPATDTQKARIAELKERTGSQHDASAMTKLEAGKILSAEQL